MSLPISANFFQEIRPLREDDPHMMISEIRSFIIQDLIPEIRELCPNAELDLIIYSWAPSMQTRPKSAAANLVTRLRTKENPEVLSFGTDGGHFQIAVLETLIFGPGAIAQMHQPDDFVKILALADGLMFFDWLLTYVKRPLMFKSAK